MKFRWIAALISTVGFTAAQAQTSTIRIACDGAALGAAVSIDGRYKADCPVDVTVKGGTIRIRATKQINGREAVFDEKVRIGEGVVKRVEIQFAGAASAGSAPVPQVQAIDPKEAAMRRYQIEKQEWEKSMAECRPRYGEYQLKRARDYRQLEQECIAISRAVVGPDRNKCHFNPSTFKIVEEMNKAKSDSESPASGSEFWCRKQFPPPEMPQ